VAERERAFAVAVHRGDLPAAGLAILSIADLLAGVDRSDGALIATTRASLSSMVVRMADAAAVATADATGAGQLADRLVAILVEVRRTARTDGDWSTADTIRAKLRELNVEVHDSDDETTWSVPLSGHAERGGRS
jgi:cysteinyl-tRNA synthetase